MDRAFNYMRATKVQTVIPEQDGLTTDSEPMQGFISVINHF